MLEARKPVQTMKAYRSPSAGLTGLNMNMNENTAGCSPRVFRKLSSMTALEVSRYPHREHCEAITARFLGVSADQVVLTNGVDEGIHLICEAYLREEDEAILVVPTFGMYAIYIQATGAKIVTVTMRENFEFPIEEIIAAVTPKTRMIALANPNNPSGTAAEPNELLRIVESAPNAAVLIDEAYFEFYGQSVLGALPKYDNLFVARTFSKAYGLAGLRLGVLVGSSNQMEMVRRVSSPYNVNASALACLPVALSDQQYVADYLRQVFDGRLKLQALFGEMGFQYWPSHANFVLARIGPEYRKFIEAMQHRGILVRDRNSDPGCEGCVRITLGNSEQNEMMFKAVRESVAEIGAGRQVAR
ncbi:MAG TPA: histidinol-phosphate transaminase [Terriglobales bacterium]|nr:histidinol-phosphate transaminase [Terriglobales bacterium]